MTDIILPSNLDVDNPNISLLVDAIEVILGDDYDINQDNGGKLMNSAVDALINNVTITKFEPIK